MGDTTIILTTEPTDNVIVVFRFDKMLNGQPIESSCTLNGQLNSQLNESQRETFEYIRVNEGCNTSMPIFSFVMVCLSYLYYRHNNRRNNIFEEIRMAPTSKKIKYGICCFFYVVLSYGLWFVCNDIICVLRNGHGLKYAEEIVSVMKLTYWS